MKNDEARGRRSAERLLATTLNSIGDAVIAADSAERVTFMNPVAEELTGWTRDEAVGTPLSDVFSILNERTRKGVENPVVRVLREGTVVGLANHTILRARDGTERPIDDSGAPIRDDEGNIHGAVLVFRDVTEQRKAEDARRRLAAIIESSEDGIVSKDLNGIVTSWNRAAERIYGWKAEDIIGKSKALVIPPDLPDELRSILGRIRKGQRIEHYETERIRKDGKRITVSISVSPVKDEYGEIIGAATIARDISEQKRMEAIVLQQQQQLESLNERLRLLNERLRRSMKETHHRVRNNLQLIAALADMQAGDESDPGSREEFDRISAQVRALAAVHDILTQEAGTDGDAGDLSSREVLEKLVTLVRDTMPNGEFDMKLHDVRVSARQASSLAIIVNELITNAMKHGARHVNVRFDVAGSVATLQISDDGPGFATDFVLDGNDRTGLNLVQHIASWDLHGAMLCGNLPGGGGSVTITMPLNPEPEMA